VAIARDVCSRFDHVFVDEYQDTNRLQASNLLALKPDGKGLTVVGDDAQSIYSFRADTVRPSLADQCSGRPTPAALAANSGDIVLPQKPPNILNNAFATADPSTGYSPSAAAYPKAPECACSSVDRLLRRARAIVQSGKPVVGKACRHLLTMRGRCFGNHPDLES